EESLHHQPGMTGAGIIGRPAQQQDRPERHAHQARERGEGKEHTKRLVLQVGEADPSAGRWEGCEATLPRSTRGPGESGLCAVRVTRGFGGGVNGVTHEGREAAALWPSWNR